MPYSMLRPMHSSNSSMRNQHSSSIHPNQPQQEQSPPSSPTSTKSNYFTARSSVISHKMEVITPPASPISQVVNDESIYNCCLSLGLSPVRTETKIKVMIVDDNSVNLAILSRILKKYFAETVELAAVMTSGVAALERLREEKFDLILMDIDMPILSGVETTSAIRQPVSKYPILEDNQNISIIAVTTSDSPSQRELYHQFGMSDCVSKPIAIPKLRSAIENTFT